MSIVIAARKAFRAAVFNRHFGALNWKTMTGGWHGPADGTENDPPVTLDGWLWPYGPPEVHEAVCRLWDGYAGCDCSASCAEEP